MQPLPDRTLWTLDPAVDFLNHGSFGATPRPVLAAQARWREEMEREPVRFLARRLPALLDGVRARLARFLDTDDVTLTVEGSREGERFWARLAATGGEEAQALDARWRGY
ncbi:MAG: aminotransferase, partial [Myxococcota bacterium]